MPRASAGGEGGPSRLIKALCGYAAIGCLLGAAVHIAGLMGGKDWLAFLGMPAEMVAAFAAGEIGPIIMTLAITALLCGLAAYGWSALGSMRPLPLARYVALVTAIVFLLRGLGGTIFLLYALMKIGPSPLIIFHLIASLFVFSLGVGFLAVRKAVIAR